MSETPPVKSIDVAKETTVLLVDADRQTSLLIGYVLSEVKDRRYRLLRAKDLTQAIKVIAKGACDVVILNYYWGKVRIGEKFLKKARQANHEVPIIVLTEKIEKNIDKEAIKMGASDYLTARDLNMRTLDKAIRYAIERSTIVDHLNHLAHHDFLTNLPNRVLFQDRLRQAIRFAERDKNHFTLMLIDLNNFKDINDNYGHDTGDKLLKEFSARLQRAVRRSDTVARVGGDEFTVILNNTGDHAQIESLADKIISEINPATQVNGYTLQIQCSIGIATYPIAGTDENLLQRNADMAMYRAKKTGTSSYVFYDHQMDEPKHEQVFGSLQQQFITALATNQIGLYFNPRINCVTDKIDAIEVNPYWMHPEKGLLEYEQFLWNGLDNDIAGRFTEWLLVTSFEYFKKLNITSSTKLVFNIEFQGLFSTNFPQMLEAKLNKYELSGQQIEFDLSQVALDKHQKLVNNCLTKLQNMGVTFGINHFGSEELSLLLLKELPINTLKLDSAFLPEITNGSDAEDTLLVKALIDFAHSLGKQIVIEGLHSQLPVKDIKELGFDLYKSVFSVDAQSLVKLTGVMDNANLVEDTSDKLEKN